MTARRELMRRERTLSEIGSIMHSMKLLAHMESRKLMQRCEQLRRQLQEIEAMAADFQQHFPFRPQTPAGAPKHIIVIGSERGFCGDFNAALLNQLQQTDMPPAQVISVGRKLAEQAPGTVTLDGASVTDEVPKVLEALVATLGQLPAGGPLELLYHDHEPGTLRHLPLLPPFQTPIAEASRQQTLPPILNLGPAQFHAALVEHYLFAALNEALHAGLLAESLQRVRHLEQAQRHLDQRLDELGRRQRVLRREEIIEEIEVILLSVEAA